MSLWFNAFGDKFHLCRLTCQDIISEKRNKDKGESLKFLIRKGNNFLLVT